jgi:hypothetical protein
MKGLYFLASAMFLVTILPTDVSAQRGGVHAGAASGGFRGVTVGPSTGARGVSAGGSGAIRGGAVFNRHPGVAMRGAAFHGGIGWRGWGWKGEWGRWPIAIGAPAAPVDYYNGPAGNGCLFLTHRGWINTCFD